MFCGLELFLRAYITRGAVVYMRREAVVMDTLVWSVVVPTGLYFTRGLGVGAQTALRQQTPETLATDVLDVDGALASAD